MLKNLLAPLILTSSLLSMSEAPAYSLLPSNQLQPTAKNFTPVDSQTTEISPSNNTTSAIKTFNVLPNIPLQSPTTFEPSAQITYPSGTTQIVTPQGVKTLPYWLNNYYLSPTPTVVGTGIYIYSN